MRRKREPGVLRARWCKSCIPATAGCQIPLTRAASRQVLCVAPGIALCPSGPKNSAGWKTHIASRCLSLRITNNRCCACSSPNLWTNVGVKKTQGFRIGALMAAIAPQYTDTEIIHHFRWAARSTMVTYYDRQKRTICPLKPTFTVGDQILTQVFLQWGPFLGARRPMGA
jgi:hypothetical protein